MGCNYRLPGLKLNYQDNKSRMSCWFAPHLARKTAGWSFFRHCYVTFRTQLHRNDVNQSMENLPPTAVKMIAAELINHHSVTEQPELPEDCAVKQICIRTVAVLTPLPGLENSGAEVQASRLQ